MPETGALPGDGRCLVLAPTGRDGALTCALLRDAGIAVELCATVEELCERFEREGAAALLLAEEVLVPGAFARVIAALAAQPPWSDLPVILFTGQDARVQARRPTARLLEPLGNVTLLDRPLRPMTMISAVNAALRQRERQYAARRELHAQQQAVRARDQFLAMLGHELRNPLAAIRLAVELLERGGDPAHQRGVIRHQTDHLARLVDDLLDVARVTSGKITLMRRPTELSDVVAHALAALEAGIRRARHDVRFTPSPGLLVDGDPARLEQVVVNLVANALKYTPEGGIVEIDLRADGPDVELRVRDTGVGIAADRLEEVFQLFSQVDSSLDRSAGGMGVGLTLVRRLVEMHAGSVAAASEGVGRGSTFTVRLPRASGPRAAGEAAPTSDGVTRRVLLVEDNPDTREMMAELLSLYGHEVETAGDGVAAVAVAHVRPPDVMLVDVGLPGLDGYGVARSVRAAHGDAVFLVAITGYGQEDDRARALSAGFDLHYTKPIDLDALVVLLGRSRLREAS